MVVASENMVWVHMISVDNTSPERLLLLLLVEQLLLKFGPVYHVVTV
jgi:hypothetical protein